MSKNPIAIDTKIIDQSKAGLIPSCFSFFFFFFFFNKLFYFFFNDIILLNNSIIRAMIRLDNKLLHFYFIIFEKIQ